MDIVPTKRVNNIERPTNKNEENVKVSIRCLVDAIVKVTGTVTKDVYVFQGGNPVDVDVRDKDEIINKKRGRSCCGGNANRYLFELV